MTAPDDWGSVWLRCDVCLGHEELPAGAEVAGPAICDGCVDDPLAFLVGQAHDARLRAAAIDELIRLEHEARARRPPRPPQPILWGQLPGGIK